MRYNRASCVSTIAVKFTRDGRRQVFAFYVPGDICGLEPDATHKATIESVGWELFRMMLEVASGRRKTWAEHWQLHNDLVLFNPAPVT